MKQELQEDLNDPLPLLHLGDLAIDEAQRIPLVGKSHAEHNKPNGIPRKPRKAERKGIIMEKMNIEALQQKLEEEASESPISLRDVPQYFKDYVIDEVVIVLPQAIRPNPNEEVADESDVYDGPARTRELNLADEGEPVKMVFIGDHLTKEESEKLRQLLKEYRDCFAWSYQDLKGISEEEVVHTIPL